MSNWLAKEDDNGLVGTLRRVERIIRLACRSRCIFLDISLTTLTAINLKPAISLLLRRCKHLSSAVPIITSLIIIFRVHQLLNVKNLPGFLEIDFVILGNQG